MELENPNPSNDPEADGIGDYVLEDLVTALNASGSSCSDKTYAFTDEHRSRHRRDPGGHHLQDQQRHAHRHTGGT